MDLVLDKEDFDELTSRIKSRQCSAFIGAGVSAGVYPSWSDLLRILCEACGFDISVLRREGLGPLEIADKVKVHDAAIYRSTLHDIFQYQEPSFRHILLTQLPFHSYLTTNYDGLIHDALGVEGGEPVFSKYPDLRVDQRRAKELFFLHGRIDPSQSADDLEIVLTAEEFKQAYTDSLLPSFLNQFLPFQTICFMGCSFEDPYLQSVFHLCRRHRDRLVSAGHKNHVRWYLLASDDDNITDMAKECGIKVIRYIKGGPSHDGFRQILEHWRQPAIPELRPLKGDEASYYGREIEVQK